MIYGIGIDLVKIERMKEAHQKWGMKFFEKFLTENEIAYCFEKKEPYPSVAVRFAAKEAVIKAISTEIYLSLKDIEIVNDESGKPSIRANGRLEKFLREKQIQHIHLSLTHEREYGVASVVLEK